MKLSTIVKSSLFAGLTFSGMLTQAAEIQVAPGVGTLQAAVISAQDGDTLVLETGAYTDTNLHVLINKSLTIKAESAAAEPVITAELKTIQTDDDTPFDHLILQGVTIQHAHNTFALNQDRDSAESLELYEVNVAGIVQLNGTYASDADNQFIMIGSQFNCSYSSSSSYYIGNQHNVVIAGNKFCNDASFTVDQQGVGATATIIGNEFSVFAITSNVFNLTAETGGTINFSANRVTNKFYELNAIDKNLTGKEIGIFSLVGQASSLININNNTFSWNAERVDADARTITRAQFTGPTETALKVFNNVFEFIDLDVAQTAFGQTPEDAFLGRGINFQSFEGNIVLNYDDVVINEEYSSLVKHNICFNNATDCGNEQGNLTVDPLLNADYRLQDNSPAVDAGATDVLLSDLDLSRNDIGAYAGSYSIDQFDTQRDPSASGPYLYPILDAAAGVANGEVKVRFVSYSRFK